MIKSFSESLAVANIQLPRRRITTLQVNLGKLCNQACHHCHVEAGPLRTEIMERATVDRILALLASSRHVTTLDLTGGAPELNPHFRYLVSEATRSGCEIIDRCNLTVLFEPGQEETADFLQAHRVHVVASLPCYSEANVDEQRGQGVFAKSLRALHLLNKLGYGQEDSGLVLDLVYNPLGASLPPEPRQLEQEYKLKLKKDFGIVFNKLYVLTNMPIKRFLHELERTSQLETYMSLLANSFNPKAAYEVMCRDLVSIGWDGQIYDCDFNQMLEISVGGRRQDIWGIQTLEALEHQPIAFANHCYGCTAGVGSSCSGSLIADDVDS